MASAFPGYAISARLLCIFFCLCLKFGLHTTYIVLFLNSLFRCLFDVKILFGWLQSSASNHLSLHCEQFPLSFFKITGMQTAAHIILFVFLSGRTQSLEWNDWVKGYKALLSLNHNISSKRSCQLTTIGQNLSVGFVHTNKAVSAE